MIPQKTSFSAIKTIYENISNMELHNMELSCAAESTMAEPPNRSADGPLSCQRCTLGVSSNDLLYGSSIQL